MDMNYLVNPLVYLIQTLFDLYIGAIVVRFLLQWLNGDSRNPLSQFLIRITHPPLRILRRFIPAIGRVDTASIVLMWTLQIVEGLAITALQAQSLNIAIIAALAVAELLELVLNIFFYATLLQALLSWVGGGGHRALASVLYSLTEPMLSAVRRFMPDIGGLDLSPMVVMFGIHLFKQIMLPPVSQMLILGAKLIS